MASDPNTLPPTEQPGAFNDLQNMDVHELLGAMHQVDHDVQPAVEAALPALAGLVEAWGPPLAPGASSLFLAWHGKKDPSPRKP